MIEHAADERARQPALRLGGTWIERQRALEQADCLGVARARHDCSPLWF
jgi:hypothetical protein